MRGKAWEAAFQSTEAMSDLQESEFIKAPLRGATGAHTPTVPGKQLFQLSPVGHMGNGRAVEVQEGQEHMGGMGADPVYLLACLLSHTAHDALTPASQGGCQSHPTHGYCGHLRADHTLPSLHPGATWQMHRMLLRSCKGSDENQQHGRSGW
jgi:hypothetical protein